jgi:hypothetical protein
MRTRGTVVLDEPITVLLWEYDDFLLIVCSPFLLHMLIGPFWAVLCALVFAAVTYFGKKGKPPGALWHAVHELELLWFRLPGLLPPRPQRYGPC